MLASVTSSPLGTAHCTPLVGTPSSGGGSPADSRSTSPSRSLSNASLSDVHIAPSCSKQPGLAYLAGHGRSSFSTSASGRGSASASGSRRGSVQSSTVAPLHSHQPSHAAQHFHQGAVINYSFDSKLGTPATPFSTSQLPAHSLLDKKSVACTQRRSYARLRICPLV